MNFETMENAISNHINAKNNEYNGEKNVKSISITPKLIERSSTTALSKKRTL